MLKPMSLRKALCEAVPVLDKNPEMMRIFIDAGKIRSTLATSLSFENQYTLNIRVTDYHGDLDYLVVPIQSWVRKNQPDIMTTTAGQKGGFVYEADINTDESVDVSISLMLTERVIVKEEGDALHVRHVPEPPEPEPVPRPVELYVNGELVSAWDE
jgi:hypothetical protein